MGRLPNINQLSEHQFINKVLEDSLPLMKPNPRLSDHTPGTKDRFVAETSHYVGQILNQLERIDQAGILVNSYPKVEAWRARYGRFEYFQYHLEQYYFGLAGLVDRTLILVNHLFDLGDRDENVSYTSVSSKLTKLKRHDAVAVLRVLLDSLQGIKRSRNRYAHSVRFWEKQLWHIAVLEFALKNKTVDDSNGYLKADLLFDAKIYRIEKMKAILENEKALIKMMGAIYDILNTEYLKRLGNFSS